MEKANNTSNGLAVTALVLGIIAFCVGWTGIFGLIPSIAALVFGILALVKKQNKGMGIAGIVLGSIALVTASIVTAITLAVIGGAADNADKSNNSSSDKKPETSQQKRPEKPKLDIAAFYEQVQNGMTKEQVVELAAKDPGSCTVTEMQGIGKYEYCSWYGSFGDNAYASVTFKDGAVESKSKTGF